MSITVVTCYYNISSKFHQDTYKKWIKSFLSIPCNMYIFSDIKSVDIMKSIRSENYNTYYHILNIEDFYTSKYDNLWKHSWDIDIERKNGTNHTVELYKLWAEKIFMCKRAIQNNVFSSKIFCWTDIGSLRYDDMFPTVLKYPLGLSNELDKEKVMFSLIEPIISQDLNINSDGISDTFQNISPELSCKSVVRIQGGFFSGYIDPLLKYADMYDSELDLFYKTKTFAGKDQYVMANIYIKNKDMFQIVTNHEFYRDPWFAFWMRFSRVPFITANIEGGLGNQLFQICHALCLSKRDNGYPIFEKIKPPVDVSDRPGYWDSMFKKLHSIYPFINCNWNQLREYGSGFNDIQKLTTDTKIYGYWQSSKYFYGYDDWIRELLKMPKDMEETLSRKIPSNCVSIHIRRTDYVKLKWCLPLEYYTYCINMIQKEVKNPYFLIFSDDIEWCKIQFPDIPVFDYGTEIEQLYALSLCDYAVMANSTFSWWGVFLNKKIKKVYVPDPWFPSFQSYNKDIYNKYWIKVSVNLN